MAFVVPSTFTAIDKMTAPMRKMGKGVKGFARVTNNALNRVDRAAIRATRSINSLTGGFGVFIGTAAAFEVVRNGINIIADYEQANANLAAVTQVSDRQLNQLKDSSFALGASTKFTATEVAGLQTELGKLGFTVPEILDSTSAVLSLASATNTDLAQTATQVGAAIRAFQLPTSESARVADVFAASISKSALDMTKLDVAMAQIAPVAKQFGFSIEDSVALMGKLADAGFEASTIATSTRSILLNLADSNGKLARALGQPARNLTEVTSGMIKLRDSGIDLASMLELTDKRSVAAFANFLEGAEGINDLSLAMSRAGGTAERMARQQLDTLNGRLAILNSAYQGLLLQQDKSNTGFLESLKLTVDVAAEVLNLASGVSKTTDVLDDQQKKVRVLAERTMFFLKIAKNLLIIYGIWKAGTIALTAVTTIYNTVIKAQAVLTRAVTVAQWAWNVAMSANPIGAIIALIVALSATVAVAVSHWETWGAALALFMGPLGLLLSMLQELRLGWDKIKAAFKKGGFIAGIKAIGLTLLKALIKPMEQLITIIEDFTGLNLGGKVLRAATASIERSINQLAGTANFAPMRGPLAPAPLSPPLLSQITLPPITEPINLPGLERQLFNQQIENTTEMQGNITISVKDDQDRLNVDASEVSENIDVKVQRGFTFSNAE